MTLDEVPRSERAVVTRLDARGQQRRRLMDLGVVPGVEMRAEQISPLGDPTAYRVRGAVIALRRAQARSIHVALDADE